MANEDGSEALSRTGAVKVRELLDEGLEILNGIIDNVKRRGNYSPESTCVFIDQAGQCIREALSALEPAAPEGDDDTCSSCSGSDWYATMERYCDCADGLAQRPTAPEGETTAHLIDGLDPAYGDGSE